MVITKPLSDLVTNLSEKLKPEDLSSLLDASKDDIDGVDEKELENLSSNAQWFQWLCDKLLLTCGKYCAYITSGTYCAYIYY